MVLNGEVFVSLTNWNENSVRPIIDDLTPKMERSVAAGFDFYP